MKKIIFCLMGLLCLCQTNSYGQSNEIYLQYGVGSNLTVNTIGNSSGLIGVGYKKYIEKHISMKIDGVYEHVFNVGSFKTFDGQTIVGGVNIYYVHTDGFQLYSGASAGITFFNAEVVIDRNSNSYSVSDNQFAYQLTALGFRLGNNIGFFAEAGSGSRGLLNAGISAKF